MHVISVQEVEKKRRDNIYILLLTKEIKYKMDKKITLSVENQNS
jgi:hypothetical protein